MNVGGMLGTGLTCGAARGGSIDAGTTGVAGRGGAGGFTGIAFAGAAFFGGLPNGNAALPTGAPPAVPFGGAGLGFLAVGEELDGPRN